MEVIHEYRGSEHRIVFVSDAGQMTEGKWAAFDQLAQVKGYYAASHYYEGKLPVGVFRLNHVPHKAVNLDDAPYEAELRTALKDKVEDAYFDAKPESSDEVIDHILNYGSGVVTYLSREGAEWFARKAPEEQRDLVRRFLSEL